MWTMNNEHIRGLNVCTWSDRVFWSSHMARKWKRKEHIIRHVTNLEMWITRGIRSGQWEIEFWWRCLWKDKASRNVSLFGLERRRDLNARIKLSRMARGLLFAHGPSWTITTSDDCYVVGLKSSKLQPRLGCNQDRSRSMRSGLLWPAHAMIDDNDIIDNFHFLIGSEGCDWLYI